jgi:hypothetical protein
LIAWAPLFGIDVLFDVYPHPGGNYDYWAGLGLAVGAGITMPFTFLALLALLYQVIRAVHRRFHRVG